MALHEERRIAMSVIVMSVIMSIMSTCIDARIHLPNFILAEEKPVTFVFGDSLTDVGNNNYLPYSLAKSNYLWYGIDYEGGKPTGRFTNGRTIGDIISSKLGIESPPPYLSLSMKDDAILHGINYASGGAGILNETGAYFLQKLSFDDQITCFEKTKVAIAAKIGDTAAEKLSNQAVYFIGMGSNDYVNNYLQPFLADSQLTHDEYLDLLVSTLDGQFRRLYGLGARKIVFDGLGPLGCIPSQRVKSRNGECLTLVNQYVKLFNSRVQKLLNSLDSQLSGSHFSFADSYSIVLDLIENPGKYGFKIGNTSCCNVDNTLGGLCLPNTKLCSNRKDYVFWDGYHPTDAANQIIADILFSNPSAQVAPPPAPAPTPTPTITPTTTPTHHHKPTPAASPSPPAHHS
ncbi:GDSL lipase/esterase protein [Dioscorea alata]|uniref:GDSL lipase/esterase protein n=1 Tax=Dioscorea alata TaxID=55571 RepID=A0ACB7U6R3_DIOAL|nr:GDSL lipase/esterase protein [Dioscorea alata]